MSAPLCRVESLYVRFPVRQGLFRRDAGTIDAVDGVSFDIRRGETLGLVGESGSGKSTTARAMLQLQRPTSGTVTFDGVDLTALDEAARKPLRRRMQMIFQDPYASLNPRMRVQSIVREPLDIHRIGDAPSRNARVADLLDAVGLDRRHATRFPHEFSGGQRQRIGIARALATSPEFVVADEPISALDVSIQAQIVNLLADLKADLDLTFLFIAHDLSMVRHLCDRVAVMYLGRIVEIGTRDAVFGHALHPYTQALIAAVPVPQPGVARAAGLKGEPPSPAAPPAGCRFHTRCPFATDRCRQQSPPLVDQGTDDAPHLVACHHAASIREKTE